MVEQIAARLKAEYDLKGRPRGPLMSPTPASSSDTVQYIPAFYGSPIETDVGHCRDARSVPADEQTLQKCRIAR
jgi:hypothetical protein